MFQDLRFGVRLLRKNPGLTFIAILTLGLGIGANSSIFNLLDRILVKPLPVDHPEQLVAFVRDANGEPSIFSTRSSPICENAMRCCQGCSLTSNSLSA